MTSVLTSARLCIVQHSQGAPTETFLKAQARLLPAKVTVVYGEQAHIDGAPVLSSSLWGRTLRKAQRLILRKDWRWDTTQSFITAFRRCRAQAVLAQYGTAALRVMEACREAKLPLVVQYFGYDASSHEILKACRDGYQQLFHRAAAIVAVSRAMHDLLTEMGAPAEKVHYNPCGAAYREDRLADPANSPPVFLASGRFIDKKAPHLTLLAFERVLRACPEARLRMVGDGGLYGACQDLAKALAIDHAVTFVGVCSHEQLQEEMLGARCFVQHSLVAISGDSEGTPVAIVEAGAAGLPVISTRHGGIPDVVIEDETGFLVDERDVDDMARRMLTLAGQPELAGEMGRAARQRIREHFDQHDCILKLWSIIEPHLRPDRC